jgi:TetR/AcrR family transcriptional regulator, multidrug resistance operon repressor
MRTKDESKEKLIYTTSLDIIAQVGLAGLKMATLAKSVGFATGTLYIYFKDKEALIRNLYQYVTDQTLSDVLKDVNSTADWRTKIAQICHNYYKELVDKPQYSIFLDQYFRSPWFTPQEWVTFEGAGVAFLHPLVEMVQSAQKAGVVRSGDPDLFIMNVRGILNYMAECMRRENRTIRPEEWDQTFEFIWAGLTHHVEELV